GEFTVFAGGLVENGVHAREQSRLAIQQFLESGHDGVAPRVSAPEPRENKNGRGPPASCPWGNLQVVRARISESLPTVPRERRAVSTARGPRGEVSGCA